MFPFAANISILYPDLAPVDGAARARAAGFDLIEMWWPAPRVLAGLTPLAAVDQIRTRGVRAVQINLYGGDTEAGDRGLLTDPRRATGFMDALPDGIRVAEAVGARNVHILTGIVQQGASRHDAWRVAIENLRLAAGILERHGMTVLLEPLNEQDAPGYLLPDVPTALEMIRLVDRPNVALQLDVYHAAMTTGDPVIEIERARGRIGHVQVADWPGRHEPGTGSLDFRAILLALSEAGYRGAIGLEFEPAARVGPDFGFLSAWASLSGSPDGGRPNAGGKPA